MLLLRCYVKKYVFVLIIFLSCSATAQLVMPEMFSDNMVLQRDKPLPVWGKATPGETITVSFANQTKKTLANADSTWMVTLSPLAASFTPGELQIIASTTISFKNVLVGDVWLCSGQSNMEYPLDRAIKKYAGAAKGVDKGDAALKAKQPEDIRYITVERVLNKFPKLPTKGWTTGEDTMLRYASAIGYFFGQEIHEKIKVPIGIISSSWGGTRIEPWIPENVWASSAMFKDSTAKQNFTIDGSKTGQMFKGMIQPMIPFAIKGILWYQGESNCMIHDFSTYPEKFRLLVETWRTLFKDADLPFYYVQISPYLYTARKDPKKHTPEALPQFWEAQASSQNIKHTGMVVTTDLVDKLSDIHPSYKWEVGHRLALVALNGAYQQKNIVYSGPQYSKVKKKKGKIIINFNHKGAGLMSSDGNALSWFTIAGEDGVFVPAEAVISKNKVIVSAASVKKPTYVRFAWNETAQPNLINKEGLPAAPFRTDKLSIQ